MESAPPVAVVVSSTVSSVAVPTDTVTFVPAVTPSTLPCKVHVKFEQFRFPGAPLVTLPVVSCPRGCDALEAFVRGGAVDTGYAAVDDAGTGVVVAAVVDARAAADVVVVARELAFLFTSRFSTHKHTRSLALACPRAVASVSALA